MGGALFFSASRSNKMSRSVSIDGVTKKFGDFKAVDGVTIDIHEGEFFTLLGPSGCGKTTLLRMIIGFNSIDEGSISFSERKMNEIPPHKRNIGMVFQNYAVFPHMTVFDNVAYGLKARGVAKEDIRRQVTDVLKLIKIEQYAKRSPSQLSGGQQQRVALARAIVIEPSILLMDEPLSNLDAKLRVEMRSAIKEIQKRLNITTVYVTHDQEEALAISDRIAVMNMGHIQQIGFPREIYSRPRNTFVAGFIGISNLLKADLVGIEGTFGLVEFIGGEILKIPMREPRIGKVIVAVRPEEAKLMDAGSCTMKGTVVEATFLGDTITYVIDLGNDLMMQVNEYIAESEFSHTVGSKVGIKLDESRINVFSADGEKAFV